MKRVSSWNSTKYITGSSFFFTIPALYSYFQYNLIFPPALLFTTTIISANYWRDAIENWRRTLDLYFAKLSFSYFVGCSFYYVPFEYNMLIGVPNLFGIVYCFRKSEEEYKKSNKQWIYYHIGFHSIMTAQLFIILNYMGKNKANYLKNILMPNKI